MGANVKFPGLPERIRERLRELGYWKHDRPDAIRFALSNGYVTSYIYKWLGGSTPTFQFLERLAKDLECPLPWLLLGEEGGPVPASPAPAAPRPQDSRRIHAKARRVAGPRARGIYGPIPVGSDVDGVVSYRTLRRKRRQRAQAGSGREISRRALVLVSPRKAA